MDMVSCVIIMGKHAHCSERCAWPSLRSLGPASCQVQPLQPLCQRLPPLFHAVRYYLGNSRSTTAQKHTGAPRSKPPCSCVQRYLCHLERATLHERQPARLPSRGSAVCSRSSLPLLGYLTTTLAAMLRDTPLPRMYDTTPAVPGAGGLGELAVVEPPPPTAHPELYSPENQVRQYTQVTRCMGCVPSTGCG